MTTSFLDDLTDGNVPEELRCQYSSKRCENPRTNKKSGGLHKFCAMHREKANRNQMRLDHRRRVTKQQQKELLRQQQAQQQMQMQQMQMHNQSLHMQRPHNLSPVAMAAGQNYRYGRTQRSPVAMKPMSPPNMAMSMPMQTFQSVEMPNQPQQNVPLFDQDDLNILEALLFSSDEEQNDATPVVHCSAPQFFRSPSFVNV
ncbi:hypothetical protein PHYBOEH_000352 [Phytophthora boehmeriae]|uniref:Uncharacterized protein n=1 Tax=Phytophthora boehmeriae TaxID=109152 RepID=A0A8T1WW55_9STRA|nr:hypothetical protein PHYBOEH_000352 [Phytophthora boehmeriae]